MFYAELIKIFSRPRTYISFIAITVIVALIHMAMYIDGAAYLSFLSGQLESSFSIEGKLINGNMVAFSIIQTLIIQVPLLVALVTGDLISGEAASGTLRSLASRPVTRTKIVLVKVLAALFYTFLLLLWLGIISWGGGLLIFGAGDIMVFKSEEVIILRSFQLSERFIAAFALAFVSLSVVAVFSLCLSCFAENSIGPIISTMAVIILFTIITSLDVPLFNHITPYLFTTHMVIWRSVFDFPVPVSQVLHSVAVLFIYIFAFLIIALYRFNRKDILS